MSDRSAGFEPGPAGARPPCRTEVEALGRSLPILDLRAGGGPVQGGDFQSVYNEAFTPD